MKLWDNHMHCHFSGDSDADPLDMIEKARQLGLSGITFTDHLDLDYKEEPHLAQKHADLLASYAFDYVIGSVHVVHTRDPYYPVYFERRDPAEAYTEYYQAVYENLAAFHNFDALGHLDYVFRYGPQDPAQPYDTYTPYAPLIDDILRFLIAHDIALEVNTGAFRCGLSVPNPCPQILKRYHELGGKLITIGADAHNPSDIALGFDRLPGFLASCGFDEYMVYLHRVPHPHSIY